jgi:hypothetical protein
MDKVTRPELYIWTSDETRYFADGFLEELGVKKVECHYLFDNAQHVHICSFQPSVWLEYVDFDFDMADDDATADTCSRAWEELVWANRQGETSHYADAPRSVAKFKPVPVSDELYEELCEMVEADPERGYDQWILDRIERLWASGV